MTDDKINLTVKKFKSFVNPELVLYAYVNDKPVGVAVTLPNINFIIKKMNGKIGILEMAKFLYYKNKIKGIRSLIDDVKKEYRNSGIIVVLYYETERNEVKKSYEWCELGGNLEDNDLINRFDIAI